MCVCDACDKYDSSSDERDVKHRREVEVKTIITKERMWIEKKMCVRESVWESN